MSDLMSKLKNKEGGGKEFNGDNDKERDIDKLSYKISKPPTFFAE